MKYSAYLHSIVQHFTTRTLNNALTIPQDRQHHDSQTQRVVHLLWLIGVDYYKPSMANDDGVSLQMMRGV